jgi:L-threonylcarbamoyladenylate synthase
VSARVLRVDADPSPDDSPILEAASALRAGGVVAVPTETVYGLCASLACPAALVRLWGIKGREGGAPIAMLLPSPTEVGRWASVPGWARPMLQELLPGPLTLVAASLRPETAVLGSPATVGIRVPDHAISQSLLAQLGGPMAATSANRTGQPPLPNAAAIAQEMGGEIDLILDGGPAGSGLASTVVDLTGSPPRLLREGAIPWETILAYASSEISKLTDELE